MSHSLKSLHKNIWTFASPHRALGLDFGGRMMVIRLNSGALILHSPVKFDDDLKNELNELGAVKYIVAPNKFHHIHLSDYISKYPEAQVLGAPGLSKKRPEICFNMELGHKCPDEWAGEVECLLVQGIPMQNEIVFFHIESRTVIFTDLIFNFENQSSTGIKIFAWLDGIYGKPDVPRVVRWIMLTDKNAARKSFEQILAWDFDRVSVTHKDIIESGGKEIVRKAFERI